MPKPNTTLTGALVLLSVLLGLSLAVLLIGGAGQRQADQESATNLWQFMQTARAPPLVQASATRPCNMGFLSPVGRKTKCVHPGKSPKCADCPDKRGKMQLPAVAAVWAADCTSSPLGSPLSKKTKCVHPGKNPKCADCPEKRGRGAMSDAAMTAEAAAAAAADADIAFNGSPKASFELAAEEPLGSIVTSVMTSLFALAFIMLPLIALKKFTRNASTAGDEPLLA